MIGLASSTAAVQTARSGRRRRRGSDGAGKGIRRIDIARFGDELGRRWGLYPDIAVRLSDAGPVWCVGQETIARKWESGRHI